MRPLAPTRVDAAAWAIGIALAVACTALASAAGARGGVAMTIGAVALVVTVVTALLIDARSHRDAVLADPGDG
jgi:hypothetical protein